MFDRAARRYDALNAILSLGRDSAWRRSAAAAIRPGDRVLDLCCGSARSAVAAHRRSGVPVIGVDISAELLALGRNHAAAERVPFHPVRADAFRLPFAGETFDTVLVAWGLRNLVPNEAALAEVHRVLRPGGALHVLDSPAPSGWSAPMHRLYLRHVVPFVGRLSPDPSAYRYLASSIEAFGTAADASRRIGRAHFEVEPYVSVLFGAAVIWRARKPLAAQALPAKAKEAGATAPAAVQFASTRSPIVHSAREERGSG
jgi:demethylmenaquinone methyltransferase/2-methoxy-6-polyprenyl-1,4-benzoquinol methylase